MKPGIGSRLLPSLLARDMHATIAFYENLGFRLDDVHPDKQNPSWVALARDGIVLMFYSQPPNGTPAKPVFSGTFYLYPDNLELLIEEFRELLQFAWGPEIMPYGLREFAIQDPNGYHLAFVAPA